ncbi:uncharacterized protein BT62DRAFT_1007460 [Guyanagaster necrorhizus]|uniref:Uncharacterized protein n=1 Tax=Guyanagaster necrorhizus TaxID=856835 RepID=A0A9P8ARD6_9AGAR|nr:uncharacterized protein BT62DRAFT_1007460 [Guyanagaster necrorhizus MCA 3950]KAG7445084.1 hypothetical protein BT62DRAFT_1007460 [Guyanagaster necrorhizus MCA 3950]
MITKNSFMQSIGYLFAFAITMLIYVLIFVKDTLALLPFGALSPSPSAAPEYPHIPVPNNPVPQVSITVKLAGAEFVTLSLNLHSWKGVNAVRQF